MMYEIPVRTPGPNYTQLKMAIQNTAFDIISVGNTQHNGYKRMFFAEISYDLRKNVFAGNRASPNPDK